MTATYNSSDIQKWYKAILFRDPSPSESNVHLLALNSAKTTVDKLISAILSTPEYENTVSPVLLIYRGILGRMPDQQGLLDADGAGAGRALFVTVAGIG